MTVTARELYEIEAKLLGRSKTWEQAGNEMRWAYEGVVREGLEDGMDLAGMQAVLKESRERVGSGKPYTMAVGPTGERHLGMGGVDLGSLEDE